MRPFFFCLLSLLSLSACASLNGSGYQHVAVGTFYQGQQVDGAECTLTNKKGTWHVTTQGSASVRKSSDDLMIACKKDGLPTGMARIRSSFTDSVWAHFVTGGAIGSTIDAATSAMYSYPPNIVIEMGRTLEDESKTVRKSK